MPPKFAVTVWAFLPLLAGLPQSAAAQPLDQVGNRASALGAFVAVADDATAVVWNPAGLVNGPIFNILLDFGRTTVQPGDEALGTGGRAGRGSTTLIAAGVLPLGISYYRTRQTTLAADPAVGLGSGREDGHVMVRSLVTSQVGVTVLQTVMDGLTVGATLKLVRGGVVGGLLGATSWEEAFEQTEALEGKGRTTGDIDVGALAGSGRIRAGIVARNLAAPSFEDGRDAAVSMQLNRQVRAGVAWGEGWPGTSRLIVAVDADLTRVSSLAGDRRDVAAGAERWFSNQRFALRGGVRLSTLDAARPLASGGASIAVRRGTYVDVYGAAGEHARCWGIAGRLTY